MTRTIKRITALDAQDSTGSSPAILVTDYEEITFSVIGSNTSVLTLKVQGALSDSDGVANPPDFSSAKVLNNEWDYIECVDNEDSTAIAGDTGIALSANDVRNFTVNVNGLDFIGFEVSAYTSGDATVRVICYNNA